MRSSRGATWLVVLLVAAPAGAAVTKDQCVDANADGQAMRLDGKFAEARQRFETCGDPSCPSIVHEDCTRRLKDLDAAQPSVLFDVRDTAGASVAGVAASMDGRPLGRLDGTAIRVDPGEHSFTFTLDDTPPVTHRLTIREGEKGRRERIAMAPTTSVSLVPPPLASPSAGGSSTPSPGPSSGMGTQKILGITAGGVGVAGLIIGSVFGALTLSAASRQKTECGTTCASRVDHNNALSDHTIAVNDGTTATVAFVVGSALVAGGAVLFFTAPGPAREKADGPGGTSEPAHGAWRVQPMAGPGVAGLSLAWEL